MQLESNNRNANSVAESHLRAAKNEIESLNRRIDMMNNQIEAKRKENHNKDEFIKQFLIGQSRANDTGELMSHL